MPVKLSRTCDECKCRKVRCVKASDSGVMSCEYCSNRGLECNFSPKRRRVTKRAPTESSSDFRRHRPIRNGLNTTVSEENALQIESSAAESIHSVSIDQSCQDELSAAQSPHGTASTNGLAHRPAEQNQLYVDLLLQNMSTGDRRRNSSSLVKAHDLYVPSSGIAFFSEKRIASISHRLGHTRLQRLMQTLATKLDSRFKHKTSLPFHQDGPYGDPQVPNEIVRKYIFAFFTHIHPVYPFLVRSSFEEKAYRPQLELLQESTSFRALYHAVLALGCQYADGGSFKAGDGVASSLFEHSIALLSNGLAYAESLTSVQALVAVAIFGLDPSRPRLGDILIAQAARMAQSIGLNKADYQGEDPGACQRTFWVVYALEKSMSFACNKTSIIADRDIGTPFPQVPEAVHDDFDGFHARCRLSRLTSSAYESIFSISATLLDSESTRLAIDSFFHQLECWRQSIPFDFRPGNPIPVSYRSNRALMSSTLKMHCYYYSILIALYRLNLSLRPAEVSRAMTESRKQLLNAAQKIVELSEHIEVAAHTSIWLMGSIPLSALFILFDFVVHNPTHTETSRNLSLLGVLVGYFSRLELASCGSIPTALLFDFVQIAREYVQKVDSEQNAKAASAISGHPHQESQQSPVERQILEQVDSSELAFGGAIGSDQSLWDATNVMADDFYYPMDEALPMVEGMFATGFADPMNFLAPAGQQSEHSAFQVSGLGLQP
ncbi:hypothetical protein BU24DRAFT_428537 [Aaosphaeria arxii CBS 175.79]|uniref:Zn(2)-C6 fungal-type domain-containing protein n=1 Tax=Aaosphaeria arxii CBS 175.79 TaxID=1450172 RepID=A0A6A5X997_9PLEO|nr:uncharacterized protein BU24DRAFT_428537 [Aaosphaeria arxii CBS 175.79]KAF2009635.1 hypothetical protein BU24DRAFT_428537 [Aaosphaeria arxii CBS 175.79]